MVVSCLPLALSDGSDARARGFAVHQHGASPAAAFAAAVLGAGQGKVVAKNAEKAPLGIDINLMRSSIDLQLGSPHRVLQTTTRPGECMRKPARSPSARRRAECGCKQHL